MDPLLSVTRSFRPYYSPSQIQQLTSLQSSSLTSQRISHLHHLSTSYIERVSQRLGFPRRTIATAQSLYLRFHLQFPLKDFNYRQVALASILVASKLEDTLKKLREVQIAGWQVDNLLEGGNGVGEGDQFVQESQRPQLIGIERLILQTICFSFNLHRSTNTTPVTPSTDDSTTTPSTPTSKDLFNHLFRLSSLLPLPFDPSRSTSNPSTTAKTTTIKSFTYLSFLLSTDLHRTTIPLSYPPHICASACLRLSGFLFEFVEKSQGEIEEDKVTTLGPNGVAEKGFERMVGEGWAEMCQCDEDQDLDDIVQVLLDLLIELCPPPPSTTTTTTSTSNLSNPSPSSSNPSPSEPSFLPPSASTTGTTTNTTTTTRQSERERQLIQTGTGNSFSHALFGYNNNVDNSSIPFNGGDRGRNNKRARNFVGIDELREVKIRVRVCGEERRRKVVNEVRKKKRLAWDEVVQLEDLVDLEEEDESRRSRKRWKSELVTTSSASTTKSKSNLKGTGNEEESFETGSEEIIRLTQEASERERVRLEEREERERDLERFGTEEEREKGRLERKEGRERGKPGSVRYRF